MIFLIEYDRRLGKLVELRAFGDHDRASAQNFRLDIELDLHRRRIDHEVVLLEAGSVDALRRTHRRYFENARQIVRSTTEESA